MKEPFDIEPFKAEELVIRQTVKQIQKDFAMFGMDIDFPINFSMIYKDLVKYIDSHIETLMYTNVQKLSALLYQVDIGEKEITDAWEKHPEYTRSSVITELLIYRELKKVIFRNYYKNYKLKDNTEE
jgi:hypothetical protein